MILRRKRTDDNGERHARETLEWALAQADRIDEVAERVAAIRAEDALISRFQRLFRECA